MSRRLINLTGILLCIVVAMAAASQAGAAEPEKTFTNPIYRGADPFLTKGPDGIYYQALDIKSHPATLRILQSKSLLDVGKGEIGYWAPKEGRLRDDLWAPELRLIDGRWLIYTCADDGDNATHRAIVLEADKPTGPYRFAAELDTPGWAIDAHVFRGPDEKLYCVWSGWPVDTVPDSTQHLFISAMKSPTELTGPAVDISGKMHPWETVGRPAGLNEGGQYLTKNGRHFLVYSASGSWTADYCLGLMECADGDFLNADSWVKHPEPVFKRTDNIYGPGHCSFTKSPDGTEDWILYHSSIDPEGSWNRRVSAKKFTWTDDGFPVFGTPPAWGEPLPVPLGTVEATVGAVGKPIKIGLIGDSTVADTYGWGPAFAKSVTDDTRVLNFARNGARLDTLSKRLDELLAEKPDYVIVQFGHNDQKKYGPDAYREKLTDYVARIEAAGAKPIIFSSVTRRNFENGQIAARSEGLTAGLREFATAAREVAREQGVPFVDLYDVSVRHHNTIGPEESKSYDFASDDQTHFSPAGAEATADLITAELRRHVPDLAKHLNAADADE